MHIHRVVLTGALLAAILFAGCGSAEKTAGGSRPPAVQMTVVPNLVGIEQSRAHALAASRGFSMRWMSYVGRLSNGHTTVRCAKVFRQSPVAGERRPRGGQIAVFEIACHTPTGRWHDAAGVDE